MNSQLITHSRIPVNFTSEELKYLDRLLHCASSYTIARSEQIDHPNMVKNLNKRLKPTTKITNDKKFFVKFG